ncbi:hypothetical protein MRX96_026708 [Rhipicephalus microplus]
MPGTSGADSSPCGGDSVSISTLMDPDCATPRAEGDATNCVVAAVVREGDAKPGSSLRDGGRGGQRAPSPAIRSRPPWAESEPETRVSEGRSGDDGASLREPGEYTGCIMARPPIDVC